MKNIITYIWLALAIGSMIVGISKMQHDNFIDSKAYLFFIVTFISILIYSLRRVKDKYLKK